jgi:hypothetical protein
MSSLKGSLIIAICFAVSFSALKAQDTKAVESGPSSKAIEFQKKDGRLLQKQYTNIGSIKTLYSDFLKLQVLSLTDLITKQEVEALIFSCKDIEASVDTDELAGLLKAINIIENDILPNPVPTKDTEIIFTSKGGLSAGVLVNRGKWSFFIQLNKYKSGSTIFMDVDKIPELVSLINKSGLVK